MRKENRPRAADPIVELDRPCGRLGFEVRSNATQAKALRHGDGRVGDGREDVR
jgi:hypothetical protein